MREKPDRMYGTFRDQEKKVSDLITESISKLGENITIRRFIRYAIGEDINFNKSFI